jgi:hypothetical protein
MGGSTLQFKHYLFHCAAKNEFVALYSSPVQVRIVVQNYGGGDLPGYVPHEVAHAHFNKWLAGAMGDSITGTTSEQLAAVIETLKKSE